MRALTLLILCLALTSCKTKHKTVESKKTASESLALSVGRGEWSELTSNTRQFDSLTLTIDYFDSLGRLHTRTKLERKTKSERKDSLRQERTDTARLYQLSQEMLHTAQSTTATPTWTMPWWLWIVVLLIALISCWRLARFLRL